MTDWPFWTWWPPFNVTLPSGDVNQDILKGWFSQNLQVNYKGNPAIEQKVVSEVASFGRQLGILGEAVLEVAGRREGSEAVERLESMVAKIEDLKLRHSEDLARDAEQALAALGRADPDALRDLVAAFAKKG